jgi:hypothetical protein
MGIMNPEIANGRARKSKGTTEGTQKETRKENERMVLNQSKLFDGMEPEPIPEKKEKGVGEWDATSWTNPNVKYKVRRDGSKWTCECYYFTEKIMKSDKPSRACKHIQHVKESLGLVKVREDLTGYKSAIQKALRRGSLPLLKLSFQKLWEAEPKWISWRLPILAAEESWKYMGMAGTLSWPDPKREGVWGLLANIALQPKNKEAEGLNILADRVEKLKENPKKLIKDPGRMAIFNGWMLIRKSIDVLETDPEKFLGWFSVGENEFAREIVATARRRSKFGDMSGDKMLLFVAAYLACVTKVDPIELEEVPTEGEVEALTEIPWYCWDMHTSIGKIAHYQIRKMFRDESMGEYISMELWFNLGSAWCDRMAEDSYWWNLCLEAWARRRKKTLDECKEDFRKWIPKIKEKVEKILLGRRRSNQQSTQPHCGS